MWALGVVLVRIMLNKNPWRVDPKLIRDRPLEAHRRSLEEQRTGAPWFERLEEGSPSRAQFENFSPGLKARRASERAATRPPRRRPHRTRSPPGARPARAGRWFRRPACHPPAPPARRPLPSESVRVSARRTSWSGCWTRTRTGGSP